MNNVKRIVLRFSLVLFFILIFSLLSLFFFSSTKHTKPSATSASIMPVLVKITNSVSETDEFKNFDTQVERFMSKWGLVGASVAIAREGKLIYAKGYGYANREEKIRTEPYHLFRVASVSKLITAVAVIKLVEMGSLSLDSKVFGNEGILKDSLYTNYLDKRAEQVTVKMLLNHSAGWTTRWGDQLFMPDKIARQLNKELPISKDDIIQFVLSKRMHFNPGTHSAYNNFGYLLAEKVIETVSGMPYDEFVKQALFIPLGITDAHMAQNFDSLRYDNEVRYYEVSDATAVPAYDGSAQMLLKSRGGNDIRTLGGAGGWVLSSVSLMRFVMALEDEKNHQLLKPESVQLLETKETGLSPLGWKNVSPNGNKWRTGSFAGTSAMVLSRIDGLQYVFLLNSSPWSGAKFPYEVDRFVSRAFQRMNDWPERDLFNPDERYHFVPFWPWAQEKSNIDSAISYIENNE